MEPAPSLKRWASVETGQMFFVPVGLHRNFDVQSFEGERHAAFGPDFEAKRNRFLDVLHCFLARASLTHTTWNGGTFDDPHSVFVTIDHGWELHAPQCITLYAER
jgi:hypothetical protein